MKKYRTSLDITSIIITSLVGVLNIYFIYQVSENIKNRDVWGIVIMLLLLIVFITSYLFSPVYYFLDEKGFVIQKVIGQIKIPFNRINKIEKLEKDVFKNGYTIRTFASGGFFGYYGKFYNSKIGHMNFYMRNGKNKIMIYTKDNKKIVVSPDDIKMYDEFKGKINN